MATAQEVIDVSAAVIASRGRILIAQRRADQRLPLLWEFPGGKREPGETWAACLARELSEELGVAARVGGLIESVVDAAADAIVSLRFYRCEILAGAPRPLGCRAVRWVRPRDLSLYRFPPADARLVSWLASAVRPRLARVVFAADGAAVLVPPGASLEEAAARARASIAFGCRAGLCGSCVVSPRGSGRALSRAGQVERDTLRAIGAAPRQRLACQATALGSVTLDADPWPFPFA
jgi:8-oxo-dGTP diphosphatase